MLKPEIGQLINESDTVYGLVVAVAKRARDIADQAEEDHLDLPDKPINMAIDESGAHKLKVNCDMSPDYED